MKQKPVLTIRRGTMIPTVSIGIMGAKPVANPADYVADFRRTLRSDPAIAARERARERENRERERALQILLKSFRRKPEEEQ